MPPVWSAAPRASIGKTPDPTLISPGRIRVRSDSRARATGAIRVCERTRLDAALSDQAFVLHIGLRVEGEGLVRNSMGRVESVTGRAPDHGAVKRPAG